MPTNDRQTDTYGNNITTKKNDKEKEAEKNRDLNAFNLSRRELQTYLRGARGSNVKYFFERVTSH